MKKLFLFIALLANTLMYSQISRANLIKLHPDDQRTTFSLLTDQEKLRLFNEKINELKTVNYFNNDEITFVDNLMSGLTPEMYSLPIMSGQFDNQKSFAMTTLGWSELKCNVIFESHYTPAEFAQYYLTEPYGDPIGTKSNGGGSGSEECGCRWSLICPGSNTCDKNSGCGVTARGCGWFWLGECDGKCTINKVANDNGYKGSGFSVPELRGQLGL